jgi:arylsulfatase A-like enzyme
MAAMLGAVDDGVGEIRAELARLGLDENTCTFFVSDNGPSRESRNWLDGTLDPYYGGTAGKLKGHKFSLYDGGIRVPGIVHWPARVPAGQVLADPVAGMDIVPTCLAATGIDPGGLELDGVSLLPLLEHGQPLAERDLYWELDDQTALRRGRWKLVLNGRLVEGATPKDAVHLADLSTDPGERTNLAASEPEIASQLREAAIAWRARLEARWASDYDPDAQGTVTH